MCVCVCVCIGMQYLGKIGVAYFDQPSSEGQVSNGIAGSAAAAGGGGAGGLMSLFGGGGGILGEYQSLSRSLSPSLSLSLSLSVYYTSVHCVYVDRVERLGPL